MGLRNLPSKTWQVNCGWVLAATIAADLSAWCRLLGLYDQKDLKDAEPDTLRYRSWTSRRPRRWRCWPWSPGRTSSPPGAATAGTAGGGSRRRSLRTG
jgi:hypothetical protein